MSSSDKLLLLSALAFIPLSDHLLIIQPSILYLCSFFQVLTLPHVGVDAAVLPL